MAKKKTERVREKKPKVSPGCDLDGDYETPVKSLRDLSIENITSILTHSRGVFFARFPHIRAIDVAAFARYRVYLAAPLFSEAERQYNLTIAHVLMENFIDVILPQENGDISAARDGQAHEQIYRANMRAIESADLVVAVIDGADADSGTAWEMGYATAMGKPVIALRTDFRQVGCEELVNLMLERSATVVRDKDALLQALSGHLIGQPGA